MSDDAASPSASSTPDRPSRWEALERWVHPVAYKDLLTFARSPGGASGRLVIYALLLATPLLAFAWALAFVPGPWRFAARPVFLGVCALFAFFHLGVAVPAATAFALERDRNTLEGLVVSPLGPWLLTCGKLLGAVAVGVLGKAAVLPALAAAYALGGGDLAFVPRYLLLLLAVDVSLAAFALGLGARQRDVPSQVGWARAQTTQTQMALQATVAVSVVTSLVPIYALIFLVPLAISSGERVAEVLDVLAPLGALHPLAALLLWGDAAIVGIGRVPVWVLGVILHGLIALPLLADCVEAQRADREGAPGRLTRLLALPALAAVCLLAASVAVRLEAPGQVLVALGLPALLVLGAASRSASGHPPRLPLTARAVVAGLWPPRALESAPARAPGYVLLVALVVAPLVVWGGGGGRSGVAAAAALALAGAALAALDVRLTARLQARDDAAFLAALDADGLPASGAAADDDAPDEEAPPRTGSRRSAVYLLLAATLLPIAAGTGLALGRGAVPAFAVLAPLWTGLAALGLACHPLSALLPVLADPRLVGSDAVLHALEALGLAPSTVFVLHLIAAGLVLASSLSTLPKPLDMAALLRARRPTDRADEGAIPPPATDGTAEGRGGGELPG